MNFIWQPFQHPDKIALIYDTQQWTYGDIDRISQKYAAYIAALGIKQGQRVAVLAHNCPEYVFAIHALTRLGVIIVPLNTRLTHDELAYQIKKSHVSLLLFADEFAQISKSLGLPTISFSELSHALPDSSSTTHTEHTRNERFPHSILFTSGTTGKPKGAILTLHNHITSANASAQRIGVEAQDRWLCVLPLYHVGGLAIIMRSALYGTAVVLHDRFDVEKVSASLDRDRVTLISLVPTMLHRLLEHRGDQPAPDSLRLVLLGGAAATTDLVTQAQLKGYEVATTYGLSEACSQVATQTPSKTLLKPASVGKPQRGVTLRIIDENGLNTLTGKIGEIIISGENVMLGYDDDPVATADTIRDGWLYTGDLGYFDTDGDLWLVQRRSDLIVSGGENIYPVEVENVIRTHPAVKEVCVIGLPSREWGQIVAVAIIPAQNITLTQDELTTFIRERLAAYKTPRKMIFVDDLPQTPNGKIERRAIPALFD